MKAYHFGAGFIVAALFFLAGCDRSNFYDHVPPQGDGSLVVDNNSGEDVSVFSDGISVASVNSGDYEIVDMSPGSYRVVISGDSSDRSFRGDVDVLDGRLTVLDVTSAASSIYDFYVTTTFE